MDNPKNVLVKNWLIKSKHDLESARKLAGGHDPYLDTAIYHCLQAVEKSLKAVLVFHDKRIDKTHDLTVLLGQAQQYEDNLKGYEDAVELLTPYATEFRYPGELIVPSRNEFQAAFDAASKLVYEIFSISPFDAP
jgi:HEPN domain-containing protein